jgi:methionine-rich copper-binding protein CopC
MAAASAILGAAAVNVGALARPAWAHAELVRASPADGATVSGPPRQVELEFDESIQAGLVTVVVTAPDGEQVQRGNPQVSGRTVVQPLRPAPTAGRCIVAYRVVSDDGHPVTGQLSFVYAPPEGGADVNAPAGAPAEPTAEREPSASAVHSEPHGSSGLAGGHALHLAVTLIVIVGGLLVVWRQRRHGDDQ